MIAIRKDLDLTKPDDIDAIFDIHFEFHDGKFHTKILQNTIAFDIEGNNGFKLPSSDEVIPFDQEKYDRGILKTHNVPVEQIDKDDEDVVYMRLLDSCTPVGCKYMWQCCVEDGKGGLFKYIGRTWDEYREFQLKLTQEIKRQAIFGHASIDRDLENIRANKSRPNVVTSWFVHNLSYEIQALRNIYNQDFVGRKHGGVFARAPRKAMKASMRINDINVTYKDTYCYSVKSLKNWAKDCPGCPIEKLDDFDYLTIKTPLDKLDAQEIEYGLHDVAILCYCMAYERELYGGIENLTITQTGKVRKAAKKGIIDKDPYWAYCCGTMTKHKTPEEYAKMVQLYQGGYVHGCAIHTGEVGEWNCWDFNSSYPSALCNGYYVNEVTGYEPCDVKEFDDLAAQDVERPKYRWWARIRLHNVRAALSHSYWSASKCIESENVLEDNGRVRRCDMMEIMLLDLDYFTFRQAYLWDNMEVLELQKGSAKPLNKETIELVLDFYGKKTSLKGTDKVSEYEESKQLVNSTYGAYVYKAISSQVYFDGEWQVRDIDEGGDQMYYELISQLPDESFGFFELGMTCSAIARKRLWDFILRYNDKVWYVDTDSIKCCGLTDEEKAYIDEYNEWIAELENQIAHDLGIDPNKFCPETSKGTRKRLGIMDREPDCFGKFLGAKRYVCKVWDEEKQEYKMKCTIAGLPKKAGAEKIHDFDDFTNNTLWTTAESQKVCCYYNDDQPHTVWTGRDGQKYECDDKYGICLKPVTFDLKMSDNFVSFLCLLFGGLECDPTELKTPKFLQL